MPIACSSFTSLTSLPNSRHGRTHSLRVAAAIVQDDKVRSLHSQFTNTETRTILVDPGRATMMTMPEACLLS